MRKTYFLGHIALVVLALAGAQGMASSQEACPAGAIFCLRPVQPAGEGSIRLWVSDSSQTTYTAFPAPFDNFDVSDQVCRVTWWGLESRIVAGPQYVPELRDNTNFTVTFYQDDGGSPPHPGTVTVTETLTATRTSTGIQYANPTNPTQPFTLYRYSAELSSCQTVTNPAWLSIVASGGSANGSYFVQISAWSPASVGGGTNVDIRRNMREYNSVNLPYRVRTGDNYDMAFALETKVAVPNVVGMTQANAEAAILAAQLVTGTVSQAYSQTVPAGSVISQLPVAATMIYAGDPVHLTVSLGNPPTPTCPANSLYGMRPALPTEGPRVWISDDLVGPGNTSLPAPYDNFDVTSEICAVTWWGTEINMSTYAAGTRAAPQFTITFYTNDTSLADHHPGTVICQHVVTATRTTTFWQYPNPYNPPSPLTMYRYSAELPAGCVVPNPAWISIRGTIAGSSNGVAFMQISALSVVGGSTPNDILRSMREFNNSNLPYRVRTGNNYDMAFCLETRVAAPDVVGMAQANAQAAITAASLTVGTITQQYSITVDAGDVISQDPVAGTLLPLYSPVALVVSLGLPPQPCPNGAIFSQPPIGAGQPDTRMWFSDNLLGPGDAARPAPYDNYTVASQICAVTWWGAEVDAVTEVESQRSAPEFEITFYSDDTSGLDPMPGAIECQYTVTAVKTSTGSIYTGPAGPVTLNRYSAELPACCNLASGWISIRGTAAGSANGSVFVQICTETLSGDMREYDSVNLPYRVAQGTNYDMAFCLETKVTAPDVVGMAQAAAEAAILAAGMTVGSVTFQHSAVAAGNVISQDPAAGLLVLLNSPMDLVVSLGPVSVPDVVGMAQAAAEAALVAADLTVGAVSTAYGPPGSTGNVLSQTPAAGMMAPPGSPVDLVISLGPAPVVVPDVVGMTLSEAQAALFAANLTIGSVTTEYNLVVEAGRIISQNPEAGLTVPYNSPVTLLNSLGLPPVEVPDVVGMTQANAEAAIIAADLTVGTVAEQYNDTVDAGLVVSQNPEAGLFELYGTPIDLVVSLGPAPVTVPDVLGLLQADAETAILAAGLTVGAITEMYNELPVGTVISQLPLGSAEVPPGTAVNLTISIGPEPPGLPVAGMLNLTVLAATIVALAMLLQCRGRRLGGMALLIIALSAASGLASAQTMVCPGDSFFSQPPTLQDGSPRIWGSDEFLDEQFALGILLQKDMPTPYDDYLVTGPIGSLVWWGFEVSALTPPALPAGTRVANRFTITFYEKDSFDDPPKAIPGTVASQYNNLLATKTNSGQSYLNPTTFQPMPLWRYSVELPTPCMLTEGFVNIKGSMAGSANGVVFVHLSSSSGNEYLCEERPDYLPYRVRTGGRYDLSVCMAPAAMPVTVPDVVGMTEADAATAIIAAGLTVGVITNDYSSAPPYDSVLSQSPLGGAPAASGTAVNLRIAREPAIVPLVTGLTQSQALDAITGSGLVPAIQLVYSETIAAGIVMSQTPLEGTLVAPGSLVRINVSRGPTPANLPAAGLAGIVALSVALCALGIATHRLKR